MKTARFFLQVFLLTFLFSACAPAQPAPTSTAQAEVSGTAAPPQPALPTAALLTPPAPKGMVFIPSGEFQKGCDPARNGGFSCRQMTAHHTVTLKAFFIDPTCDQRALC
jgi:formylglycine-generating enzyme required for sulfatase activity